MAQQISTFGFALNDVARLLRRNFNRRMQDMGLTQAQWQVLVYVSKQEGLRQSQLAEMMEMQPISVGRLLDRMEQAGWVERRPDPSDRRAVNLYIADKAEPILEKMRDRAAVTREQAMKNISADDRDRLMHILDRMRENLIKETLGDAP